MFKYVIIGISIFLAFMSIMIFSGRIDIGSGNTSKLTGTVKVWGIIPEDNMGQFISSFNGKSETFQLDYHYVPEANFEYQLVNALASGAGPDLIIVPYNIVLSQRDRITPVPEASVSADTFKKQYLLQATALLSPYGAYGLPVATDPLILYYNRDLFSRGGITAPPVYWDELNTMVPKLTIIDNNNNITQSAIALGTYDNVPHAKEILSTMVQQFGVVPVSESYSQTAEGNYMFNYDINFNNPLPSNESIRPLSTVLRFYSNFADPYKVTYNWNSAKGNAKDEFLAGRLAMYIGKASESREIKEKNKKLVFDFTYLPQARGYGEQLTGGNMYAISMLRSSQNPNTALYAMTQLGGVTWNPSLANSVGGITPINNLLASVANSSDEVLVKSALIGRSWLDIYPSKTDNLYREMINNVRNLGKSVDESADIFVTKMTELYNRY